MSTPEPTKWLVDDRHSGKTTKLMQWLIEGKVIEEYPGWSRALVLLSTQQLLFVREAYPGADQILRERGCPGGLGKVLLSRGDIRGYLRGQPRVELAVDDAEELFAEMLGIRPAVVSVNGELAHDEVMVMDYRALTVRQEVPRVD